MTAPVFLVPAEAIAAAASGGTVLVAGDEGRHGASAKRLRTGESVDVVDGQGRRVSGDVVAVAADAFTVLVRQVADEPLPRPEIVVVQALAKGERSELAVEMLTECGVDRIVPWAADHAVVVWRGERVQRGLRRWRAVAQAAAKQSRRSRIPEILGVADAEDVVSLLASAGLALVLHEGAAARLSRLTVPSEGTVVLIVGPEGGISHAELERFAQAGALPVRMGESILRTSTAGVAAAAVVMANSGRWH